MIAENACPTCNELGAIELTAETLVYNPSQSTYQIPPASEAGSQIVSRMIQKMPIFLWGSYKLYDDSSVNKGFNIFFTGPNNYNYHTINNSGNISYLGFLIQYPNQDIIFTFPMICQLVYIASAAGGGATLRRQLLIQSKAMIQLNTDY